MKHLRLFPVVVAALIFAAGQVLPQEKSVQPKSKTTKPVVKSQKAPAMKEIPLGVIEMELYTKDAPKTTENFMKLAERKYFNGIIFHRVAKGFVIQGGDPTGTGSGGKSIWGKEFADELNPQTASFQAGYVRGVVAMANRGPNTNTSQFFIMLVDNKTMPKNYTIFGKVVSGMDVVDKIGNADITPAMGPTDGRPVNDYVMKTVSIVKLPDGQQHAKFEVVERPKGATGGVEK